MNNATESTRRRADKFWSGVVDSIHNGAIPLVQAIELTESPVLWAALAWSLERSAVPLRRVNEAIPRRCLEAGIRIVDRLAAWQHSSALFREAAALLHKAWVDGTAESCERANSFVETTYPFRRDRIPHGQEEWAVEVERVVGVLLLARQQQENPFGFTARHLFEAASEVLENTQIAKINFDLGPPSPDEVVNAALGIVQW